MNQNLTDVTFLIDRSASMRTKKAQVEETIAEIIGSQRTGKGKVNLTVTEFDSVSPEGRPFTPTEMVLRTIVNSVPIEDVKGVTLDPRGNTPLYDALAVVIDDTGKRLATLPEEQRPGKVVFVIVTDGGNNDSKRFTPENVAEKIKHQEQVYNWLFMYVGCDQNAVKEAQAFGLSASKSMSFASNEAGYRGLGRSVSSKLSNVRGMSTQEYSSYNAVGEVFDANDRAVQADAGVK
jgi:hypothetical protein